MTWTVFAFCWWCYNDPCIGTGQPQSNFCSCDLSYLNLLSLNTVHWQQIRWTHIWVGVINLNINSATDLWEQLWSSLIWISKCQTLGTWNRTITNNHDCSKVQTVQFNLTYWACWGQDKMADILQSTFSNASSWMKILVLWFNFHWNCFFWSSL